MRVVKDHLWNTRELVAALGSPAADGLGVDGVDGIGIDSRTLRPGDLFIALSGDPGPRFQATSRSQRDGHDYIDDAAAKGAALALVHRQGDYPLPVLRVADTLDGLWALGRAGRARSRGPMVAVTGSSGKTTFKSFAATALGAFATSGSLNNHLGVPLSLARAPRAAEGGVYEIGTNHPGEIEPLAKLVRPHVAVVLNVHPAHIGNFGSLDAIRREKTSIAKALDDDGALVHPLGLKTDHHGRAITFGSSDGADVCLRSSARGMAHLRTPAGNATVAVPGGGPHRALSVAALAAVLIALDLPLARLRRLAALQVPRGRGNRLDVGDVTLVDESYNANPSSMAATLEAFRAEADRRRIAIVGDMLELGADATQYHQDLAPHCAGLDGVFCVGEEMKALYERLPPAQRLGWAERADETFVGECAAALQAGDIVLVKGSNGIFWARGFVAELANALERRRG